MASFFAMPKELLALYAMGGCMILLAGYMAALLAMTLIQGTILVPWCIRFKYPYRPAIK